MADANRSRETAGDLRRQLLRRCLGALPIAPSSLAANTASAVEPGLLAFGAKVPSISQLPEDTGALHRGLEALDQRFPIFTVTNGHK